MISEMYDMTILDVISIGRRVANAKLEISPDKIENDAFKNYDRKDLLGYD